MNPLESYLTEKQATTPLATPGFAMGFRQGLGSGLSGSALGGAAAKAALGLGATAATALATAGVQKLYDAATKSRDFKSMLELNPDLAAKHQENPRMFNQMFSTLRTFNPAFSRDPLVAGSYMRQMAESPEHAGIKATEALNMADKARSPLGMEVMRAAFRVAGGGGHKRPSGQNP